MGFIKTLLSIRSKLPIRDTDSSLHQLHPNPPGYFGCLIRCKLGVVHLATQDLLAYVLLARSLHSASLRYSASSKLLTIVKSIVNAKCYCINFTIFEIAYRIRIR